MTPIEIPFHKRTLANGLRVIVHRDSKAPIVTVSVWYHVGSKNDAPGKTGFAHLFEHLMFEGSRHHDAEFFRPLEDAGASVINGTTNRDRTNYFETVPRGALDLALWLESDRMGYLEMTQAKLDEQREVVRNEKKQSENQPYGRVSQQLSRALYPDRHPYSWPIIGYFEDLEAAALTDVEGWFKTWYRPNNAVLVVSGDVEIDDAFDSVERYFAPLEAGPPLDRQTRWIGRLPDPRRVEMQDRVPQARVIHAWNVPPTYDLEYHHLALLARVLATGKTSRLYKRLVYDEQIATDVSAQMWSGEIGSSFLVQASCAPGAEVDAVERALDEELDRIRQSGVEPSELERAQRRTLSGFLRGIERTGGFGGKSEVLAHGEVFAGDPAAFRSALSAAEAATSADLRSAAASWLGSNRLDLVVQPVPEYSSSTTSDAETEVLRSSLPTVSAPASPDLSVPAPVRLDNGLEVYVVTRPNLPTVHFRLIVDAGFVADQDSPRGTATLTMAAIDEGTSTRSALEISDHQARLGARLFCGAGLDHCNLGISSLAETQLEALDLLAEVTLQPSFPDDEIERLRAQQLARIQRELVSPVQMAMRVLPARLYGNGHPYGMPFTGSGSPQEVEATRRTHLLDYHRTWIRPQRAALVCVGDVEPEQLLAHIEHRLGDWGGDSPTPAGGIPAAAPETGRLLLIDRPGSIQSIVFGGQVVPPRSDASELDLDAFHTALGGSFTSRLNLNLREDKGWTYGAHSLLWSARGERPFLLYSSVQSDATAGALREMDLELRAMLETAPITDDELDRVQRQLTLSLPARRETLTDIASDIEEILTCDLAADYYDGLTERIAALTPPSVTDTARRCIDPDGFIWVVVGDLAQIRGDIDDLGWGNPIEIDSLGEPV